MLKKSAPDRRRPFRQRRALLGAALVLSAGWLAAPEVGAQTAVRNPEHDYIVDIPAGWRIVDAADPSFISFTDPERVAVFQVVAYPGSQFATVEAIDQFFRSRFSASGESDRFAFHGTPAIFADLSFDAGVGMVRGYMVFLNGDETDYALMTIVPTDRYDAYHDFILSALDSFSPDLDRTRPGPVSVYLTAEVDPSASPRSESLALPSGATTALSGVVTHPELVDAAQVLIEREARVLAAYAPPADAPTRFSDVDPPLWATAWRRFFRAVYRDNFDRLTPVADALFQDLATAGIAREQMPAATLEWLQAARFERTRSLSDLMSPAACLIAFAGDCDSLGITYAILLEQLGFDAILMVSVEYAHAMVGVDIEGEGARFPFENRDWLVAEMTEPVGIGQIAADMSEIEAWIGVKLDPTQP